MPEDNHGRRKVQYLTRAGLLIAILATLGIAVFWILTGIQNQMNARLASSLQTVLDTTDKALRNWAEQTEIDVAVVADLDDLRANVEAQLAVKRTPQYLLGSPALRDIRHLLASATRFHQFPGFSVIAPDGIQIAAQRNESV